MAPTSSPQSVAGDEKFPEYFINNLLTVVDDCLEPSSSSLSCSSVRVKKKRYHSSCQFHGQSNPSLCSSRDCDKFKSKQIEKFKKNRSCDDSCVQNKKSAFGIAPAVVLVVLLQFIAAIMCRIRIMLAERALFRVAIIFGLLSTFNLDIVDAHSSSSGSSSHSRVNQSNVNNQNHDNFHPRSTFFRTLDEFSSHTVIKPQLHHARHKRALRSTLDNEVGLHIPHITLSYHHQGQKVVADLHLNEDLFPQEHFLRFQSSAIGGDTVQNFTKTDIDLCHYQGNIRGKADSRVAISTCNGGINGVVFDETDTYYIYSGPDGRLHDDHFLFRHDNLVQNATCGYDSDSDNDSNYVHTDVGNDDDDDDDAEHDISTHPHQIKSSEFNRILRYKRSNPDKNIIRGPYNANKYSSYVELVIVVDNKVYKSLGENLRNVHKHCQDLANIVNALYVPLNIFIALVGVVVWNESNEIEFSNDGDITLKNFLHYRRTKLAVNHPNDNAQLLTKEQFIGGVVGKALKGPICTYEYSGGVSMEHSQVVAVVATTMAHEMGHNFGMEHDTADCKCVDEKCIMSASSTSVVPRHWSSCSIDQLNVAFSRGMNYCLRNKPTKLFDSPHCGNGFVEPGEQCDCGMPAYCQNTCCDPNTCMLRTNASCATGECCDLSTCRPKSAGTECRGAEGECDLAEYCTGESEYCPTDVYKRDTEMCDRGNAFCYQGSCRSRSNQCKILWGPSGESSDHCYGKNVDGSRHGNCGFDRLNNKYVKCTTEDVFCGMLHCRHLNERLEFGMESVAVLSHSFMNHDGSIIPCRTAIVDLGLQSIDPGLTPNGAKCGDGKMCVDQKCVKIDNLQSMGRGVGCPEDCNGNGICNSKGHCHCYPGFGTPTCSGPGPGGSEDSGPATNPNGLKSFTRIMYIFFLGVVPTVSLILGTIYYWEHIRLFILRKPTTVTKSIKVNIPRGPSSPSNGGLPTSSPSSTDDMNSALLKSPSGQDGMDNGMFGKFKGFTLRPLPNATSTATIGAPNVAFVHPVSKTPEIETMNLPPVRAAPPPPKVHDEAELKFAIGNGTLPQGKKSAEAPALPPPNPGSHPRPIISSPVLETSTCTAKELVPPLKTPVGTSVPVRAAPTLPPSVLHPAPPPPVPPHADPKLNAKSKEASTIKRITSFLKKDESQKHPPKVKPVIDKEKLRNIEISAPIPVVANDNSDPEQFEEEKTLVKRAQSMRSPTKKQGSLQSFASMRQPSGTTRPKSVVGATRPKSPPPRPPALPIPKKMQSPSPDGYQTPIGTSPAANPYDDCEAVEIAPEVSPAGSDNIYAVIDENPPQEPQPTASSDGMGLLGEIVNEIEKRNVDSIYSASTLKRKKTVTTPSSSYANIPPESSDNGESEYSKSTGSTTSSGYLRPSAINAPVARVAPTRAADGVVPSSARSVVASNSFSSFKPATTATAAKPKVAPSPKPTVIKPTSLSNKSTTAETKTANSKPQNVSQKPKPLSTKPPIATHTKPLTGVASVSRQGTSASDKATVSSRPSLSRKTSDAGQSSTNSKLLSAAARPAPGKPSNVASLQQKFEGANKK